MSVTANNALRVLAAIVANPRATHHQLGNATGLHIGTVGRQVTTLETDGAFTRRLDHGRVVYDLNLAYIIVDNFTIGALLQHQGPTHRRQRG